LQREPHNTASHRALSRQDRTASHQRSAKDRHQAATKQVETKRESGLREAAKMPPEPAPGTTPIARSGRTPVRTQSTRRSRDIRPRTQTQSGRSGSIHAPESSGSGIGLQARPLPESTAEQASRPAEQMALPLPWCQPGGVAQAQRPERSEPI